MKLPRPVHRRTNPLLNQNDYALLKMLERASRVGGAIAPRPGKVEIDRSVTAGRKRSPRGSLSGQHPAHFRATPKAASASTFPAENKLIAGDTLFSSPVSNRPHTDLPGGFHAKELLRSLHDNPCWRWPDETVVVPGHGPADDDRRRARKPTPFLVKR